MQATIDNLTAIAERLAPSAIEMKPEIEEFVLINEDIDFCNEHHLFESFGRFLITRPILH